MRFDERLGLSDEMKTALEELVYGPVSHVLFTSSYHVPLTVDAADNGDVFIRAATGTEVADALTTGDTEAEQKPSWGGDAPTLAEEAIQWQQHPGEIPAKGQAVLVWEAEVLFKNGRGQGGSFFAHKTAAAAEAFSSALAQPAEDVSECQIVPYACARQFAPALLRLGDVEARRLTQYEVSPLRPYSAPRTIPLVP